MPQCCDFLNHISGMDTITLGLQLLRGVQPDGQFEHVRPDLTLGLGLSQQEQQKQGAQTTPMRSPCEFDCFCRHGGCPAPGSDPQLGKR